ncbi:MAG TPA: carbohydrate ABC transporter permease [Atribacteraceae bacterium]|nr:carbohydrate ABC transporter permease [Atribacteraceae bacterium]
MKKKKKIRLHIVLQAVGLVFISILTIFPIYWTLNVSLLPEGEIMRTRPHYFPPPAVATIASYIDIFTQYDVLRNLANSIIIVVPASLITLMLSFSIAYVVAKYSFRWKKVFLYGIIWLMALPWIVYVLPIFQVANSLRLLDTHILLIMLYGFSGIPLFTWFALPYLYDFPNEMIDAGRLDGCSEVMLLLRIVIPPLKNALLALFILRFVWAYNDLLYALSFAYHHAKMIMPTLLEFPGFTAMPFAKMAAGGIIAVLPILLIVIFFQNYVVSGLTGRTFK